MKLVIVESPTKAKTITKFLGSDFVVESSFGHVRDLPVSKMGIDIEHNFEPKYVVPKKAKVNLKKLQDLAKKSDQIILATDEDREGEAIAWHLAEALKVDPKDTNRIVFHEITKPAIEQAIEHPRKIDMKLVDAQQARRVLDRLVGYELSPFLWKKVAKGLSAGRVQSVAVRLIIEREREIKKFNIEEYWTVEANLQNGQKLPFLARLNKANNKTVDKLEIKNEAQATEILTALKGAKYLVADLEKKQTKKQPPKPFTTSSLQQTANRWLGFSAKQTMMIAQQLYEMGFITYMRTDSLNLADKFLTEAALYLKTNLGEKYSLAAPRRFKTKDKGAQEAHEAIRPSEASRAPETVTGDLNPNQNKLYKLIWQRAVASQMTEAIVDATVVDIDALHIQPPLTKGDKGGFNAPHTKGAEYANYQFRANGQIIKFDGYLKIYPEASQEIVLPEMKIKEELELLEIKPEQHFTKPPARYSDAGLVKELEKHGIGRPSTYAPTINTIIERNYVQRDENKRLGPTDIAFVVIDLLVEHFPKIVDYEFTAKMENDLDTIAQGEVKWQPIIKEFYDPFHANLESKYETIDKNDIVPEEKTTEICDKCGAPMIIKTGRYGKFLACSAFPECKNIKSMPGTDRDKNGQADSKQIDELKDKYKGEICGKCGAPMVVKVGKFGPFLACSGYPKCKNIKSINGVGQSTGITCPVCKKGEIVQKRSRRGIFYACNQYPDCKTAFWGKPTGEKCPDCDSLLIEDAKKGEIKCSNKECGYTK